MSLKSSYTFVPFYCLLKIRIFWNEQDSNKSIFQITSVSRIFLLYVNGNR